ncbi:hypothetical protein CgunFtcFv8_010013 [Champsocephalus gunnari]|uniref:Secreted protein n=1 Tax=Champsocephalus gunnari TaxID=52237 RepID=A0AAN8C336_CHAGU|nr:hypothetical protein CgunFtcFv8_010013 [Champsocephalus gunnari]
MLSACLLSVCLLSTLSVCVRVGVTLNETDHQNSSGLFGFGDVSGLRSFPPEQQQESRIIGGGRGLEELLALAGLPQVRLHAGLRGGRHRPPVGGLCRALLQEVQKGLILDRPGRETRPGQRSGAGTAGDPPY